MKRFLPVLTLLLALRPGAGRAQGSNAFDSALHAARQISQPEARIRALRQLEGRLNEATPAQLVVFDETLLAAHQARNDDSSVLTSHINLGLELTDAGRYDEAFAHFSKALPIARRLRHPAKEASAYMGLGFLYKCIGEVTHHTPDFAQAMAYYNHAAALSAAHALDKLQPQILENKAQLYDLQHQPGKALALYRQAEPLLWKSGRKDVLVPHYMNMGISLKNDRQYEAALQAYQNASLLLDTAQAGLLYRLAIRVNIATLYQAMGRNADAEALALDVRRQTAALGLGAIQADATGLLARITEDRRAYPQALAYTQQLLALKDTLLNQEKAAQLAAMQTRFDVRGKDAQLAEQTGVISRNRVQSLYLWAGLVLLAGAGAILYAGRRRARRLNRRILQQQAELEAQRRELQQVNDLKDRLFSVIGHDLRAPVHALTSFTVLLDAAGPSPEKLRQYIASLKGTLDRTGALLENLLHFARAQMQGGPAVLRPVAGYETAEDALRLAQPHAAAKGVTLENAVAPGTVVQADPDMLALIFRNLVGNAVKFSHPGGHVRIAAAPGPGTVQFSVQDAGVGMAPELVARFNTAAGVGDLRYESTYGTGHEKGTGLGLLLCKTFTDLMEGTIRIAASPGAGTTVTLTLRTQAAGATAPAGASGCVPRRAAP